MGKSAGKQAICGRRASIRIERLEDRTLLTSVVVNTTIDGLFPPATGIVSLRSAIAAANSNSAATTITFDPAVFAAPQTIVLSQGKLQLTNLYYSTTIIGPSSGVTINGNAQGTVIDLEGRGGSLSGLTITNGSFCGVFVGDGATLNLANATVSGNTESGGGGGGGIWNGGTAVLTNVTISNNTAVGGLGGGIETGGPLTLTNCTISGNTAGNRGGGITSLGQFTTTIANSIIAGNFANTGEPDAYGSFNSLGYNLVGMADGSNGWNVADKTGTVANPLNPMLASLGNYGGPTQTMVPLPGSPTIDSGWNALALDATFQLLATDQRGFPRIAGSKVDMGAAEFQPQPIHGSTASPLTLKRGADGKQIDWTVGTTTGHAMANDPEGFRVIGDGGNDPIILDNSAGNPLPYYLLMNGTFTVSGLSTSSPFASTVIDIGQSTVYFSYSGGNSPVAPIQAALATGYNGGAWNGPQTPALPPSGVILSTAASSGPAGLYGIGYADSADGIVSGQPVNTVEVRFTVMGDANLDRVVDSSDAVLTARNYLMPAHTGWDQGNFNYDGTVDFSDASILQKNYSATAPTTSVVSSVVVMPTSSANQPDLHPGRKPTHRGRTR